MFDEKISKENCRQTTRKLSWTNAVNKRRGKTERSVWLTFGLSDLHPVPFGEIIEVSLNRGSSLRRHRFDFRCMYIPMRSIFDERAKEKRLVRPATAHFVTLSSRRITLVESPEDAYRPRLVRTSWHNRTDRPIDVIDNSHVRVSTIY